MIRDLSDLSKTYKNFRKTNLKVNPDAGADWGQKASAAIGFLKATETL
jgi:hypothetical protein